MKKTGIPKNLPPEKIANFLNTQLIADMRDTLTKGRGKYFILEEKKEEYLVEYDYLGKMKISLPIEAVSKKQVKQVFQRNYNSLCNIKRILTIDQRIQEISEQSAGSMFKKRI